ncbi:hypothetical protein SSX86_019193 [Deinandra increscens subsp. villosa]|uniref:AAA+ ATPase domain-containing protein n=1 Tax=Deinandra increscens subsp. villosa TaxID=3103831 RepID=A0AAP0GVF0_9ASTR
MPSKSKRKRIDTKEETSHSPSYQKANVKEEETKRVDLVTNEAAREEKWNTNDGPRFKDLGGIEEGVLDKLGKVAIAPLLCPQLYDSLGVRPSAGILLHGPPGCGKTTLAHAIANECTGVPFYKIAATELVSGVSGASEENIREENIRELFSKAENTAPSIVFIDEIDVIGSKRDKLQRGMEVRIVTQLMTCMDSGNIVDGKRRGYVLVIGATNRPDALDPALRRPGRFDHEIALGVPDESCRTKILSALTRNVKMEGAFDLVKISRLTPGFVGADLAALVKEASGLAIGRAIDGRKSKLVGGQNEAWWEKPWDPKELECSHGITMADFEAATKLVQASTKREGFTSIPNVKWEDVGGLDKLRRKFYKNIVRNIRYPNVYEKQEDDCERGFLLFGPPGCGKTLIAQAVANEAGANFIHIRGPEILNKYVGESELAVRTIFSRARTCSPCILFLDEIDALTKKRGKEEGSGVERVLTQLLTELDGGKQRKGVYVIGATNMPEAIDPALLRPGRLGEIVYVPLPNEHERVMILKALSRNRRLDADVDLNAIAQSEACANLSGDDLSKLIRKAARAASEEKFSKVEALANEGTPVSSTQSYLGDLQNTIKAVHFEKASRKISPSLSEKVQVTDEDLRSEYQKLSVIACKNNEIQVATVLVPVHTVSRDSETNGSHVNSGARDSNIGNHTHSIEGTTLPISLCK